MLYRLTRQLNEMLLHLWCASAEVDDVAVAVAWYASLPNPMLADQFVLNNCAAPHHSEPTADENINKLCKEYIIRCLWYTKKNFKQSRLLRVKRHRQGVLRHSKAD